MSAPTSRLALTTIDDTGSDDVTIYRTAVNNHAAKLDTATVFLAGVVASRPAAGLAGRLYFATDVTLNGPSGTLYFDTGSAWLVAGCGPDTGWVTLTLATDIQAFNTITPAARVDSSGMAHLKGSLFNNGSTVTSGQPLATIPASPTGMRPADAVQLPVVLGDSGTTSHLLTIAATGVISFSASFFNGQYIPLNFPYPLS